MTDQEKNEARNQYKALVDEINSATRFLFERCKTIHGATITLMQEAALGEAQVRFYQPKTTR